MSITQVGQEEAKRAKTRGPGHVKQGFKPGASLTFQVGGGQKLGLGQFLDLFFLNFQKK